MLCSLNLTATECASFCTSKKEKNNQNERVEEDLKKKEEEKQEELFKWNSLIIFSANIANLFIWLTWNYRRCHLINIMWVYWHVYLLLVEKFQAFALQFY